MENRTSPSNMDHFADEGQLLTGLSSRWRSVAEGYHDLMENHSDKRVKNWFLMSGPMPTTVACILYIVGMKIVGPRLMKNRKPYDLTKTMVFYNFFQMLFNLWILSMGVGSWLFEYSFVCQPVDFSYRPGAIRMLHAAWWFYFSKFIDWFDTLFFVMRKKFQHLSVLHLVHHGLMPFSIWWGVKFCGGGQSTFFGLLNTQVHVIMYLYYSLAALGPKYQKYLWWKKYLTTIQMVQFLAVLLHSLQLLFVDCNFPKVFVYAIIGHALLFIGLFSNFYINTYIKKPAKLKVETDPKENGNVSSNLGDAADGDKSGQNGGLRHRRNAFDSKTSDANNAQNGERKSHAGLTRILSTATNGMCIQQAFYDGL